MSMDVEAPMGQLPAGSVTTGTGSVMGQVIKNTGKTNVRAFLNRYRSLGLPGAKKMRRKTRLEHLATITAERDFYKSMIFTAAQLQARAKKIIEELSNESNFACHETAEGTPGIIEWVADDKALNDARKFLKEFTSGKQQPQPQLSQKQSSTDNQNAGASQSDPAPIGQP